MSQVHCLILKRSNVLQCLHQTQNAVPGVDGHDDHDEQASVGRDEVGLREAGLGAAVVQVGRVARRTALETVARP